MEIIEAVFRIFRYLYLLKKNRFMLLSGMNFHGKNWNQRHCLVDTVCHGMEKTMERDTKNDKLFNNCENRISIVIVFMTLFIGLRYGSEMRGFFLLFLPFFSGDFGCTTDGLPINAFVLLGHKTSLSRLRTLSIQPA